MRRGLLAMASSVALLSGCGDTGGADGRVAADGSAVQTGPETRGAWDLEPELTWSLEPEIRIGVVEGSGADAFGRIRNVIPREDGGVWVFDWQAFELRRFDADGNHVLSVGQQGQGPGEFSGNACAHPGVAGEIWVETETSWHRFDEAGQFLGTFPTPSGIACSVRTWLPDGRYMAADGGFDRETREMRTHFVILEWTGDRMTPVDTVQEPDHPEPETVTFVSASGGSRSTRYIPFAHTPMWRMETGGMFWVWDGGGAYDIRLQTLHGDTIRRIGRGYTPIPVDGEVRRQAIAELQRPGWEPETSFDASRVPNVYPPFESVKLAEDGSVWVSRTTGSEEVTWEVFADDDTYLGVVEIPESLKGIRLREIGADHLWGIVRDEFDVQYVVRARIVKPGE